jgi:hypothetical protein
MGAPIIIDDCSDLWVSNGVKDLFSEIVVAVAKLEGRDISEVYEMAPGIAGTYGISGLGIDATEFYPYFGGRDGFRHHLDICSARIHDINDCGDFARDTMSCIIAWAKHLMDGGTIGGWNYYTEFPPALNSRSEWPGASMHQRLFVRVLAGLEPRAHIELGFIAARLALAFWKRAFPEKQYQAPLINALKMVETFSAIGQLAPGAKEAAELAYRTVSSCDLPAGDIQRSSGFSVAHIAMAPWLISAGRAEQASHNAMVAIRYSESIHDWAGRLSELEAALISRARELRGGRVNF